MIFKSISKSVFLVFGLLIVTIGSSLTITGVITMVIGDPHDYATILFPIGLIICLHSLPFFVIYDLLKSHECLNDQLSQINRILSSLESNLLKSQQFQCNQLSDINNYLNMKD